MSNPLEDGPRLPEPFGAMQWSLPPEEVQRKVWREAVRHCPELRKPPSECDLRVHSAAVPFFGETGGYELVRLSASPREPASRADARGDVPDVYAFHADGDFRPLDAEGQAIDRLRLHAPIQLESPDEQEERRRVADYACLRLALEGPLLWHRRTADDPSSVRPRDPFRTATVIATLEGLPIRLDPPDATARNLLERLVRPPTVDLRSSAGEQREESRGYRVEVSLVFMEGRTARVARAVVDVDLEGRMSTPPEPWEESGRVPLADEPSGSTVVRRATAPQRVPVPPCVDMWERVPVDSTGWVRRFVGDFGLALETVVIRLTRLPFYRTFVLVEVLERRMRGSPYRRSYVMLRTDDGRIHTDRPRPLNGTSRVIHEINAIDGELRLDEGNVDHYLRFFCWAVHADGGPFLVPHAARALPFEGKRLSPDDARRLMGIDYRIVSRAPEESGTSAVSASLRPRRAIVAYSTAVFEAWFAVHERGEVEMLDDTPLIADLPLPGERYGEGALFVLRSWKRGERRPAPRSLWRRGDGSGPRPRMADGGVPMDGSELRDALRRGSESGRIVFEGRTVTGPVVLAGRVSRGGGASTAEDGDV